MKTRRITGVRLLAAAGALAMAMLSWAAPARADEPGPGNIKPPVGGMRLTLHKCVQPQAPGAPATGAEQQTDCTPIDGVTFELYKVTGLDLTTSQGWDQVAGIQAPESGTTIPGYGTELRQTKITERGGLATFEGLEIGLYLVVESNTGAPNTGVVLGSRPFLVTLPYVTNNEWNYDVHVYPKNSVAGIEKTVTDDPATIGYLGQNVVWKVTTDIPLKGQNTQVDRYVVTDNLPAGLAHVSTSVQLSTGEQLELGSDVTCTTAVVCTFNPPGLAKLNANPGAKVVTTITTNVDDVARATRGVFTNTATFEVNGNVSVERTAQTTWGQLKLHKFDPSNNKALKGAQFNLCLEAHCATVVTTLTTDATGAATVPALRPGVYHLVETAAPSGYTLDAAPKEITIVPGETVVGGGITTEGGNTNYKPVPNTKQNIPQLPMTGGVGQVALIAGGVGMFVVALAVVVFGRLSSRRKR